MNIEFFTGEFLTIRFFWVMFTDIQKEPRDFMFRGPDNLKEGTRVFSEAWRSNFLFYRYLRTFNSIKNIRGVKQSIPTLCGSIGVISGCSAVMTHLVA